MTDSWCRAHCFISFIPFETRPTATATTPAPCTALKWLLPTHNSPPVGRNNDFLNKPQSKQPSRITPMPTMHTKRLWKHVVLFTRWRTAARPPCLSTKMKSFLDSKIVLRYKVRDGSHPRHQRRCKKYVDFFSKPPLHQELVANAISRFFFILLVTTG